MSDVALPGTARPYYAAHGDRRQLLQTGVALPRFGVIA